MSSEQYRDTRARQWRTWTITFAIAAPLFVMADGAFQLAQPATRHQWMPNRLATLAASLVATGLWMFAAYLILRFRGRAPMRRFWSEPVTAAVVLTIQGMTFLAGGLAWALPDDPGTHPLLVLAGGEFIMAVVAIGGYFIERKYHSQARES